LPGVAEPSVPTAGRITVDAYAHGEPTPRPGLDRQARILDVEEALETSSG
jgi:hypothetical protein